MGIDCCVYLPPETRVKDVASAIGLLAGCESTWRQSWVVVNGIEVQAVDFIPCCANIRVTTPSGQVLWALFHFEFNDPTQRPEGGPAWVGIMPSSTPLWCGIATGLVRFFGGGVDYQDCEAPGAWDFAAPRPRPYNNPCDGAPWDEFQRALAALQPVDPMPEVAAYL